jgi:hypothetical protein
VTLVTVDVRAREQANTGRRGDARLERARAGELPHPFWPDAETACDVERGEVNDLWLPHTQIIGGRPVDVSIEDSQLA